MLRAFDLPSLQHSMAKADMNKPNIMCVYPSVIKVSLSGSQHEQENNLSIRFNTIHMYSGITSGRVLD